MENATERFEYKGDQFRKNCIGFLNYYGNKLCGETSSVFAIS